MFRQRYKRSTCNTLNRVVSAHGINFQEINSHEINSYENNFCQINCLRVQLRMWSTQSTHMMQGPRILFKKWDQRLVQYIRRTEHAIQGVDFMKSTIEINALIEKWGQRLVASLKMRSKAGCKSSNALFENKIKGWLPVFQYIWRTANMLYRVHHTVALQK